MTKFRTQISDDMATEDDAVPRTIKTEWLDETIQGDSLHPGSGQLVFQFYTGNGFRYYVALLDWDVSERLTWPKERDENIAPSDRQEGSG